MAVVNRAIAASKSKARPAGKRLQIAPALLIALFAIVLIGLLRVVQTSQATTASFAMQSLRQEKIELQAGVSQLEAEVARLSSLSRIEREAERLGLKPPVSVQDITVNVPWPAAAEDPLPARFAPAEEEPVDGGSDDSEWWRDLLRRLPF